MKRGHLFGLSLASILLTLFAITLLFGASAQAAGGNVMGWGYNANGQTGIGKAGSGPCECVDVPTLAPELSGVAEVSPGYDQGLALMQDGTVRAWGYNGFGELGDGTTNESLTPVQVPGLSNVVAVSAGYPTSLALLSNGTVAAWGSNEYGELGQGSVTGPETCGSGSCSTKPIPIPGLSNVIAIAAGYYYDLALLADGRVMFWGYDYYGESGNGTGTQSGCECISQPTAVPGVANAVQIAPGGYHALALLADGTVSAWGYNYEGQLGTGSIIEGTECDCSGAVSPSGLSGVKEVAAGYYHSLALLQDGTVKTWGENGEGQLGDGSHEGPETCSPSSYPCSKSPLSIPVTAQLISSKGDSALAESTNGIPVGWGENSSGQLGDGTTEERDSAVPVSGLSGFSELVSGEYTSNAIVGPSQALNVAFAGAGSGVVGGQRGVLCSSNCTARFPQSQVKILRAIPSPGSGFAGFTGPCTGTGTCQVKLDTDQTVTATFGPPAGTVITKSKIKRHRAKKHKKGKAKGKSWATARFAFSAPGAITGYECELVRPKPKKHHRKHHSKGKHHARASKAAHAKFSACASPKVYKHLRPGKYTFKVRAVDILGVDAHPAVKKFRVRP
jgi:alpha-tubulin suppressor-like RCC1 family protein